ncbi:MAG: AAA family ATPase [Nitrospinae bacterium]|nr:AAA family ATPase [Nitrospinota bacterium]
MITFRNLPAHSITVLSGKGGVGKTTFSIYLAVALAKAGKKVLLIDSDFSLGKIHTVLKIKAKHTFFDFINGEKSLNEIIVEGPYGIKIIPAASGITNMSDLSHRKRDILVRRIKVSLADMDYIIVDCPSGIAKQVIGFALSTKETLCICNPEVMSLTDAYAVFKVVKKINPDLNIKFLMNKAISKSNYMENIFKIYSTVKNQMRREIETLGYLPVCPEITNFDAVRKSFTGTPETDKYFKKINQVRDYFLKKYPEIALKKETYKPRQYKAYNLIH